MQSPTLACQPSTLACQQQDRFVRKAIETDILATKENVLRKRFIEDMHQIPFVKDFPYIIDVEYLCFQRETPNGAYNIRAGQGDLLLTDGHDRYVVVEIKSSFVCYNGSDRIFLTKTCKLLEQVQTYMTYQRMVRPNATIYGCGVTEQKVYWFDVDNTMKEFWWSSGPEISVLDTEKTLCSDDMDAIPDDILELHSLFESESIFRHYPRMIRWDPERMLITYLSKCQQKRMTVSRTHLSQEEIQRIVQDYHQHGCYEGHIMMFGMQRPTILIV